jgi:peptidoglycan LD-endopeptidase LytH
VPRVAGLGRSLRAGWFLTSSGVLLVAVVAGGTLHERGAPAAGPRIGSGWTQPAAAPGGLGQRQYTFPVAGAATYRRTHHDYPAADILAQCGSLVRAVTDGIVLEVNRTDRFDVRADDGATRGGRYVSILGDDGVRYYGSHLRSVAIGVVAGARVGSGDVLGVVGESGDASTCHLHFGISPPCARAGDWWIRRGVVWPWSFLDSWRDGAAASPVGEVSSWYGAHGCPPAPPAA